MWRSRSQAICLNQNPEPSRDREGAGVRREPRPLPLVAAQNLSLSRMGLVLAGILFLGAGVCFAADKDKKEEANTRSVQGVVTAPDDTPVSNAVVQLKNTKTLQIRSFFTQANGSYYFHDLSADVDYTLRADYKGESSPTRTLSAFDSRKLATMNLKLNKSKPDDAAK
jgi:Carboxypeptidase regulatory-like domain